jgi:WD40 repeat protein
VLSPHGKTIVAGSFDECVRAWDLSSGKLLATFRLDDEQPTEIVVGSDNRTVAIGGLRGGVHVLELARPSGKGD